MTVDRKKTIIAVNAQAGVNRLDASYFMARYSHMHRLVGEEDQVTKLLYVTSVNERTCGGHSEPILLYGARAIYYQTTEILDGFIHPFVFVELDLFMKRPLTEPSIMPLIKCANRVNFLKTSSLYSPKISSRHTNMATSFLNARVYTVTQSCIQFDG